MDDHDRRSDEDEIRAKLSTRPLRFQQHWEAERASRRVGAEEKAVMERQSAFADFVVSLRFTAAGGDRVRAAASAAAEMRRVVVALTQAGLGAEVRQAVRARRGHRAAYEAEAGHVLVFVSCARARLVQEWRRSRLHDWLGGMLVLRRVARDAGAAAAAGAVDPYEVDPDARDDPARLLMADAATADAISVAERQRLVYRIIVGAQADGGAAVRPDGAGVAVLALHDAAFNREWVRHWARKWLVDGRDLRRIREHFGEEIALYFAFLQSYFLWLALPAAAGLAVRAAGGGFAWPLAAALVVWTVVFTETWARRESDIATYWGVHGVQRTADARRTGFVPDGHSVDPATGEQIPVFSPARRWARRAGGVAVIAALAAVLAALVAAIFALQTFVGEFYAGPLASVLGLAPVVLFSACLPAYTAVCTRVAYALTEYENYEYEAEFTAQLTVKLFVFRFLQDQLYLFLTAWVFVPYRDTFERWLSRGSGLADVKASDTPAAAMVQTLLAGFVVTSQALNLVTETVVPLALRWWAARTRHAAASAASATNSDSVLDTASEPAQQQFIARVAEETRLPEYSTFEDYAEMASQFGRVAFFSIAWPLAPLAAFVNNWFELRGDAAKIAGATQRPIPRRVDSIGPWLGALRLMCWLASITNALLVYQFNPGSGLLLPPVTDADAMKRYGRTGLAMALVVLLFAEHAFLAVRWLITRVMASWPSAYTRIVERSHALSRRRWLERAPLSVRDLAFDSEEPTDDHDAASAGDWRIELETGLQAIDDAFKTG
ncbi:hypothetical protein LPJ64_002241 [Coemansia asiatica]|uniref:DUF590-domain-containing protein n=1 Tax=Coemansia asiatica TaxID=1052880 RepID=A0A9W8CJA3_9FUNG|nr:hypothetical protein LPJ64_002241 [Coemansia asiatica]